MPLSLGNVFVAVFCVAAVLVAERAFPFLLFSHKEPPPLIRFIEKYIPPMVMAALVVYCLKDVTFSEGVTGFVPPLAGVALTVLLHLWRRNSLLSIFGGTAVYMILLRLL